MGNRGRHIGLLVFVATLSIVLGAFSYQPLWEKVSSARPWRLGLDLAGGSFLTYRVDLSGVPTADSDSVVRGLRDVIEKRVNPSGVGEQRVYTEAVAGESRIVIELPGERDVARAIATIGATPLLDFREVEEHGTSTPTFIPTALTGRYVKSAQVSFSTVGKPQVNLEFNSEGAAIFEALTEKNIGKSIAIFLDNVLIEMPTVQEKIPGGRAQITGQFSIDEARALVERFNAGALPAPIVLVNQQTIDADFGAEALDKAVVAGAIGTIAVMLFMVVYYRSLGLVAALALLMYIALTLGLFKLIPVTMTLAGIAGFILSIGMAVDANILVFERMREEMKKGRQFSAAIEEGFARAWTSIRDSNISTMITAGVLYYFTSSFVRGFALTLFLGVVVSMISAITVSRTLLRVFARRTT